MKGWRRGGCQGAEQKRRILHGPLTRPTGQGDETVWATVFDFSIKKFEREVFSSWNVLNSLD